MMAIRAREVKTADFRVIFKSYRHKIARGISRELVIACEYSGVLFMAQKMMDYRCIFGFNQLIVQLIV